MSSLPAGYGFKPSHNTHENAAAAAKALATERAAKFFSSNNNSNSSRPTNPIGATAPKLNRLPKNTELGKPALYIPSAQAGGYKYKKRITHKRNHKRSKSRTRSRH